MDELFNSSMEIIAAVKKYIGRTQKIPYYFYFFAKSRA